MAKTPISTEEKKGEAKAVAHANPVSILLRPRITEKATQKAMDGAAYVFDIAPRATKADVSRAVSALYKVKPVKVAVVPVKAKQVFVRGRYGMRSGGKKAYVYLKKGDKIEFA